MALSLFLVLASQGGEPATRVYMNGVPAPVFFNDGDTYRVLAGKNKGMRARLGGFNTLETFGPVHKWGTWNAKELYVLSKEATMNGRRGVWRCESKTFEEDTYGRILWFCRDLAIDHLRRGLAHAMSIDYTPADPELIAIQREAMANGRGMWAHGVPRYLLTSLHSISEGGGKDGKTYNRLVSTFDGHSAKWSHDDKYSECEWVCRQELIVPDEVVNEALEELIVDQEIGDRLLKLGDAKLWQVVSDFAWLGYFGGIDDAELTSLLEKKLKAMREAGKLGDGRSQTGSCALFVVFERRYGPTRASCLK